jgi:[ribosomal protein S5]-alanine N-acetyltransferase
MTIKTAGVYMLAEADAEAIQLLAADPAIAATTRVPHPYPENGARDFIAKSLLERAEGSAHVFAIKDRSEVVGVCGLHGIENGRAEELGYWIGRPFWGNGYATFAVGMVLQFAFFNLRLTHIRATALQTNAASRRVLEKNAFQFVRLEPHRDPLLKRPQEPQAVYEITRQLWTAARDRPALASLHPALKQLLTAELAAGNEIAETGGGWPDPDSIFVRLRHPFRARPTALPDGVVYTELNDPHWWKADYSSKSPRHVLAC